MQPEWRLFERWLARMFGGKRSYASGSTWSEKEDVRGAWAAGLAPRDGDEVLVQAKCSGKKASIKAVDVDGLVKRAAREGRTPVVALKVGPYVVVGQVQLMEEPS
jgi:uncharacterized membrane protein